MKEAKNNSYETEPSSSSSSVGSRHSLSGPNNECLEIVDVSCINLAHLLQPRIFEFIEESCTDEVTFVSENKIINISSVIYKSSPESPFVGFRETPLKEVGEQRFIYDDSTAYSSNDDVVFVQALQAPTCADPKTRIFDTIVNEDSCNAVDMPISGLEPPTAIVANLDVEMSDLSFNGKIKELDLNCTKDDSKVDVESEQKLTDLNSSSFLKYSRSPDLFADVNEEEDSEDQIGDGAGNNESLQVEIQTETVTCKIDENIKQVSTTTTKDEKTSPSVHRSFNCRNEPGFIDDSNFDCAIKNDNNSSMFYRENCKRERELLRRIQKCLCGLPPPPSMTIPQIDLINMVLDQKSQILGFFKDIKMPENKETNELKRRTSLFKPTHKLDDALKLRWSDVLSVRQHGFCYNLTSASEHCELLSLSVVERFVGAETTSSYRRSPSNAKKRNLRDKLLTQSPGNRLSHLAKRRAIFSSANLATTSQRSATAMGPQIVVDKNKSKGRRKATPKRKTPGSKKKTRRTSSSARKLQYGLELTKPAPSRETSKRALFQSPMEKQQQKQELKAQIKPEIATKVEKSKRALFSRESNELPTTSFASQQFLQTTSFLKRKRIDNNVSEDDESFDGLYMPSKKFSRCDSANLTPRALKIKSQSFSIGAGFSAAPVTAAVANTLTLKSDVRNLQSGSFSNVSLMNNTNFGEFETKSQVDNKLKRAQSEIVGSSASLTDNQRKKLLWAVSQALQERKITTKHENFKRFATVLARVVRRTFQEFYQRTSTSNSETLLRLAKKYVFYVTSERSCDDIYAQVRAEESKRLSKNRSSGSINHMELNFNFNQGQQTSLSNLCWEKSTNCKQEHSSETKTTLQNSSSKSNFGSLALRENSAQKNFTGKNQRNISPYSKSNSGLKIVTAANGCPTVDCAKAKRQIFFDS